MTSSKTEAITQKSESEAKPAGIVLPITEMTDDWMDDDMAPGEMDSDTESENLKEEVATKSPQTQDVRGERKPAVAGIALPTTEMTDDWMDDGEAIGSMESEEEEGSAKPEENPVEEVTKPQNTSGIALPITEMTDDWMDDGEALGSMDSEDEEEPKVAAEGEKGVQGRKSESEIQEPTETTDGKSATDNVVKAKTTGITLPTSEMTFDWMDDDTAVGSIESEEEETDKKPEDDIPAVAPVKETKPAGIALPITEMTDDWMEDDVAIGSIDSDEDEEVPNTDMKSLAKTKDEESPQKMEINKSDAKKAPGIALPITEMTDDWMDDDVAIGSIESDDEEETPHTNQGSTEETKIEESAQQSDTNKSEEKKAPGIILPITEMTDDWMDE